MRRRRLFWNRTERDLRWTWHGLLKSLFCSHPPALLVGVVWMLLWRARLRVLGAWAQVQEGLIQD